MKDDKISLGVVIGLIGLVLWMIIASKRDAAERYEKSIMLTVKWGWWSSVDFTTDDNDNDRIEQIEARAPVKVIARRRMHLYLYRNNGTYEVRESPWGEYTIKQPGEWHCYFPGLHPERPKYADDKDPIIVVR